LAASLNRPKFFNNLPDRKHAAALTRANNAAIARHH
jgi:hypothetical protein